MRWYVNRNGTTEGPLDESVVADMVRHGKLHGATVRDEQQGSAWMGVAQSPFARLAPTPGVNGSQVVAVLGAAVLMGWCYLRAPSSTTTPTAAYVAAAPAPPPPPPMFHGLHINEVGVFGGPSGKGWLTPDRATFKEITSYAGTDSASAARLINTKATVVTGRPHARLLAIDGVDVQVQITDGPHAGKTGWAWGVDLHAE